MLSLILLFTILFTFPAEAGTVPIAEVPQAEVSEYEYEQTKDLVQFVHNAAGVFAEKGEGAFPEFRQKGGKWFKRDRYLFIYDLKGTCVFHPVDPELEGKDLIRLKDLDGKPVIRYVIETVTEEPDPYGWVHYLWAEPGEIFPRWKSSYVLRVKSPEGAEYVIGSGIYNMRPERKFIVDKVDEAAELIRTKGARAFEQLQKRSSRFVWGDTYIFVLSMDGKAVVDPAFPSMEAAAVVREGRDLTGFRDAMGKNVVIEMIDKLRNSDSAWVMYMWPRLGESTPSRKVAYIKKVSAGGKSYIVGSDIFLANPIWMKL